MEPSMRAMICDRLEGYRGLECRSLPRPTMKPGCVRIAVHHAAVGFGESLRLAGKYQRKLPLPFIPGTEVAGIVTEVADDVRGFAAGDRVAAALDWGGYAEEAVAASATTWHVPSTVPLATAASVPLTYGTSHAALHWRAGLRPGQTLVVYGAAGGVGLSAVEVGRQAGAHVIAVAGSQERVRIACEHGAHAGLLHADGDRLGERIVEANGGRKVDVVYDPVGGRLFDEALRCLRPEGRVVVVGFASGEVPRIAANLLLVKNIEVIGFNFGLYIGWGLTDEREFYRDRLQEMMATLFGQVAAGALRPQSGQVFPLERAVEAFDCVIERRSLGRVLLEIRRE
jgi:NADPH:quinone reductase